MLTPATEFNLKRKSAHADHLQVVDGAPLFSWLDLNITELCNRSAGHARACTFCPRIDAGVYPNQNLHMDPALAWKIGDQLRSLSYEGAVILCGFSEPLLHPQVEEIAAAFRPMRVEVVTNGDRLNPAKAVALYEAGVSYVVVSMYDGPRQIEHFVNMFAVAGVPTSAYLLRDRWYGPEKDFGIKLTNRAGTIDAGTQRVVDMDDRCFYPSYSMAVDWNGDVLLCVQDWNKRLRFGNLNVVSLMDAWRSKALHKRRLQLIKFGRQAPPCADCNAEGTCHGERHASAWVKEEVVA